VSDLNIENNAKTPGKKAAPGQPASLQKQKSTWF
jgi:hypothetical protein